ncbi:alpha/beta hydrolase [Nocardioides sp. TRM66260-LWL]|uniref:alpha/beta hydrolase n=1 Tax=Nocardioides sp. TRM66260-LWL TaxID=2874478 RepID=UPI001CC4059A|nr:alpha/beta hydrolase [Nocardioides sp. TRM66260-LWL]MBZ5736029.1 alpha/beta hydrolase [Nocardioides sp. TRM66260-LWL]
MRVPSIPLPVPAARAVVRLTLRPALGPTVPVRRQRRLLEAAAVALPPPRGTHVVATTLGGRPADVVSAPVTDPDRAVLYLHGGGYTVGSPRTHRALAAHLSATAAAPVHALDYRLAPEHPHPAAIEDAEAAFLELAGRGLRVAIAGDSAGGGLALALAVRLRDAGGPTPTALALVSPWVDLTLVGVADDPRDPLLTRDWLAACATRYAGPDGPPLDDPALSPLHADLAGLPPTIVHGSEQEILLADVERVARELERAGTPTTYRRLEGVWHVVHLQAGTVAPATEAVADLGRFLRRHP